MRALLIAIVLSGVGDNVWAEAANQRVTAFDPCFQIAGAAAAICGDPRNGAAERLDCQKTRERLDQCFAHAAKSAPSETRAGTGSPEMPYGPITPESPAAAVSPNKATGSPGLPYGAVQSKKPNATVLPDKPTGTVAPEFPAGAGLVGDRSANENMTGLQACFQAARIGDETCSKLPNDSALRVDCSRKTRAAQLDCLERVLSETPPGPTPKAPSETTRPQPAATATLPKAPPERVSPEQPGMTGSSEKSDSPTKTIVRPTPPGSSAPTAMPTAAIRPDIRPRTADDPAPPSGTNWLVSETTSPVDYSPLVTALIRSTSPVKDAPTTLAVRCRGKHIELLARTDGNWTTSRGNKVRVDYQINDEPAVRLAWIASADGKSASYKGDAAGFLQSLPEGAQLKINVFDGPGASHEATFQLTGLDTVRNKIALACNGHK